jgi:hypothetical protein
MWAGSTALVYSKSKAEGIAKIIFDEMKAMFKKVGVDTVYVFVDWRDWHLLKCFDKMGTGDMINLKLKIDKKRRPASLFIPTDSSPIFLIATGVSQKG